MSYVESIVFGIALLTHFTTQNAPSSTKGQDSSGFVWDVLSTLPVSFQHTGAQVVRFLSDYVKLDESKGVKSFHWTEFKNAVDNLPDVDFVIEAHTVESVAPGPVVQLPTAFASILTQKFKMPIAEEYVAQTVQDVLERLDYAKQDGVANFHVTPSDSTKNTSAKPESVWEYRLLMMAPNAKVPNDFHAQVAVLELKAQKEHESDWTPLTDDLQATSAKVTMMKIVVSKGFRRPVPTAQYAKA